MLTSGQTIHGVTIRGLVTHRDKRGGFTEVFSREWPESFQAVQWSLVRSEPRSFRGMHLHRRHQEYFLLAEGRACVGLYDLRPGSPSRGAHSLYELRGDPWICLLFPPGLLHGWYFYESSLHLQGVSENYSQYPEDDNAGCRRDDPELGIPWPFTDPILSERAAAFPSLRKLKEKILNP